MATDLKSRAFLYAELSKFARAGFGIDKACESIIGQPGSDRTAREICRALLEGTRSGKSMAESLVGVERYPITELEIAMIDAAERGGQLEVGFEHLADYFRQENEARQRIRRAMIYPLVLLHFALVVGIGMTAVMRSLGDSLSGSGTAGAFDWKESVGSSLVWVGIGYAIALSLIMIWRQLSRKAQTSASIDTWMQRLPLFGPVRRARGLARFCEVLHIYLLSGQRMDLAWRKAGEASQGGKLREYTDRSATRLAAGESVSDVVANAGGALPGDFTRGLASADLAGSLDLETARWAEYYREASAENAERLANWAPKFFYWMVLGIAAWMIIRVALSYNDLLTGLLDFNG